MNRYEIHDELIDNTSVKILQDYFIKNQNNLNWFYFESVVNLKSEYRKFFTNPTQLKTKNGDGFVIPIPNEHVILDGNILKIIENITKKVEEKVNKKFQHTLRTKINLTKPQTFTELDILDAIHLDRQTKHISFIYYINTNDGGTILFENDGKTILKKVDCIENRVLVFDGLTPHAGIPSTNNDKCVINFNVLEKEKLTKLI
jgi:hypothetical protein